MRRAQEERGQEADGDAVRDDTHALPEDEPQDVPGAAPERHADADVLRMLLDVVGHHAVDAHDREDERDRREPADQHRQRARALQRPRDEVVQGGDAGEGQGGVEVADDLTDGRRQRERSALVRTTT